MKVSEGITRDRELTHNQKFKHHCKLKATDFDRHLKNTCPGNKRQHSPRFNISWMTKWIRVDDELYLMTETDWSSCHSYQFRQNLGASHAGYSIDDNNQLSWFPTFSLF